MALLFLVLKHVELADNEVALLARVDQLSQARVRHSAPRPRNVLLPGTSRLQTARSLRCICAWRVPRRTRVQCHSPDLAAKTIASSLSRSGAPRRPAPGKACQFREVTKAGVPTYPVTRQDRAIPTCPRSCCEPPAERTASSGCVWFCIQTFSRKALSRNQALLVVQWPVSSRRAAGKASHHPIYIVLTQRLAAEMLLNRKGVVPTYLAEWNVNCKGCVRRSLTPGTLCLSLGARTT